jgi:hypothetical protein
MARSISAASVSLGLPLPRPAAAMSEPLRRNRRVGALPALNNAARHGKKKHRCIFFEQW